MTALPLGPLAQVVPRVSTLLAQRGVQALVAGLVAGAVGGSAMMITGLVRFGEEPAPTTVALMACPGSGPVLAEAPAGQALLVTARSVDGGWLQVYLGEPGIDRAWAPASVLRLASSADVLPVAECAAPTTPTPFPTPTATAVVTPTPSPEPTATLTGEPTAIPTPTPSATPTSTSTAKPDTTPPTAPALSGSTSGPTQINLSWSASTDNVGVVKYRVYRGGAKIAEVTSRSYSDTGLTPSTTYSYVVRAVDAAGNTSAPSNTATLKTPAAPSATPAPTATPNAAPTLSNLTANPTQIALPACPPYQSTISVTVTDPGDSIASVTITVSPPAGASPYVAAMSPAGGNVWTATITANSNGVWSDEGYVHYVVTATDSGGASRTAASADDGSANSLYFYDYCLF